MAPTTPTRNGGPGVLGGGKKIIPGQDAASRQLAQQMSLLSPKAKRNGSASQRPTQLLSATVWDVISPPPINSVKGTFAPGKLARYHRHRRVSVEVHRVQPTVAADDKKKEEEEEKKKDDGAAAAASDKDKKKKDPTKKADADGAAEKKGDDKPAAAAAGSGLLASLMGSQMSAAAAAAAADASQGYEECYIRILVPASKKATKRRGSGSDKENDDDTVVLVADDDSLMPMPTTPPRPARKSSSVVSSLSNIAEDASTTGTALAVSPPPSAQTQWLEKYRFPLRDVEIKKREKETVYIHTKLDYADQTREVIFDSVQYAIDFCTEVEVHMNEEEERSKQRRKAALGGLTLEKGESEMINLLIEVVSGTDLPAADLMSSDPMVKVMFEGKEIHETKFISSTLNPVWTVKTQSLCSLSLTAKELFDSRDGLTFMVQDYDKFGGNELLGCVIIPPRAVYSAKGERVTYPLKPRFGEKDYGTGELAVRIRRASDYDTHFMEKLKNDEKAAIQPKGTKTKGGKGTIQSIMTRNEKTEHIGHGDKKVSIKKFKIRPHPDPERKEETKWMTKEDLQAESMKESRHWIDIGSGNLGKVYLEIIGCDGLPQLDSGAMLGNKTDAFVSVVFEDSISKTDVIDDTLSPRWMPWSQRAFELRMMHPSSQLYLGVFDYDDGMFDDHDLIGRVSVDLTGFYPGTEYLLSYNITPTDKTSFTRENRGKITCRLRIEYADERQLPLVTMQPPPNIHVNQKKAKDWRCARYTTLGRYEMEPYSQTTIGSYVEEIMLYLQATHYITDGIVAVLFWRGHMPVRFKGKTYCMLPMHSFNLFLCMITLVERPSLLPSFQCACIAWMLLSVMGYRRNAPNPWDRTKSFVEIMEQLFLGKCTTAPENIPAYENAEEAEAYREKWEQRLADAQKLAEFRQQQAIRDNEEWLKEMEEIGDTDQDITTKAASGGLMGTGVSIDPLKPILYPIQQYLAIGCDCLRFTKNVIIWEECYFAALISLASLVLAVVFAFVPWAFIIRWTSRLIVWGLFGPWMKLADIYWYSKLPTGFDEEELKRQEEEAKKLRKKATKETALQAKIAREDAQKLRAIKKYMFGKFIVKVPVLKLDRYRDIPLAESSATPYEQKSESDLTLKEADKNRTRVAGQHLVGDMIPAMESKDILAESTGQAVKDKALLDEKSPDANDTKNSTTSAVPKIAGAVVAAVALTWFGIPLIINGYKLIRGGGEVIEVIQPEL